MRWSPDFRDNSFLIILRLFKMWEMVKKLEVFIELKIVGDAGAWYGAS